MRGRKFKVNKPKEIQLSSLSNQAEKTKPLPAFTFSNIFLLNLYKTLTIYLRNLITIYDDDVSKFNIPKNRIFKCFDNE